MNLINRFLLIFLTQMSFAHDLRVSSAEAEKFCNEIWFSRLRIESGLSDAEVENRLDNLLKLYTEDASLTDPNNEDVFGKAVLRGPAEIKHYYRTVLLKYPNWHFDILAIYPTQKGFVLHYTGHDAPPVKRFTGVDILEIERGVPGTGPEAFRISRLDEFYDRLPFTRNETK